MTWLSTGRAETDFNPSEMVPLAMGGVNVVVVRLDSGEFVAFRDQCSHQPVALSDFGEISGNILMCQAHGACFDLSRNGQACRFPAKEGLKVFPVKIEQLVVFIDIP